MHRIKADLCVAKVSMILLVHLVVITWAVSCPIILFGGWFVPMLETVGRDGWSPFVYPQRQFRLAIGFSLIVGCFWGLVMWIISLRRWSQIASEKGLSFRRFAMLNKHERNEMLDAAKSRQRT